MTHKEYMKDSSNNHHEYFLQFAPAVKHFVEANYTKEQLKRLYKEDKNLNNLPDNWMKRFDLLFASTKHALQRINNQINEPFRTDSGKLIRRGVSLSDNCCAIKAYMRHWAGLVDTE
jgi:hypothetical protein